MKIIYPKDFKDIYPETIEQSWDDFVFTIKAGSQLLFGGAEFEPGKPRYKKHALRSHILGLDFDSLSEGVHADVMERLEKWSCINYQTKSDNEGYQSFRVIFRLREPIEASDWTKRANEMYESCFPEADRGCLDITRLWYTPSLGVVVYETFGEPL